MRVLLDECVLYPPSLRDLLLTLAALDAFDVRWSETILEELRRNVVADNPHVDPDRFSDHTLVEMRRHFPAAMVSVGPTTSTDSTTIQRTVMSRRPLLLPRPTPSSRST